MKWPLLPVALLFALGILLAETVRLPLAFLFAAAFAVIGGGLAWEKGRMALLGLLIVLTGWTDAAWHNAILAPWDLRRLQGENVGDTAVRGRICAPPTQRVFEMGARELWHSSALIEVSEIRLAEDWEPASGAVIATATGGLSPDFYEGQRVEVRGVLRHPNGPVAEGLFDARAYYRRQGVYYQLQTAGSNDWTLAAAGATSAPVSERFRRWAARTLELGFSEEDEALRLMQTLMLDWKAPLTDSVEEPFMRAGTYHIFAVDGLRIGLLTVIAVGLARGLRVPRAVCGLVVIPALWFYVGLTGWPASAIRAAIMASVVLLGWACRRPGNALNSLCAAALLILLWEPAQLWQAGFQLSFLVVACVAMAVPPCQRFLRNRLWQGDPMLPGPLQPARPWWVVRAVDYVLDGLAVCLAAWAGSIPLAAYYFHLFTPGSVAANCVVVPATALALMGGTASLLTGAWCPALAILFNNATWGLMRFIIFFSERASHWSLGNFNVAPPPVSVCLLYYAAFFLIAGGWIFRARFGGWVGAALLGVALVCGAQWRVARQNVRVSVLPLRGAPAVFVDSSAQSRSLLLNCGGTEEVDGTVKPFLCAHGINHLDAFCVGVGLRNYFDGAQTIVTDFLPRGIYFGAAQERSASYGGLLQTLRRTRRCQAVGDGGEVGGWTVLHPAATASAAAAADDNAVVLWREVHGHSILLLPTLGRAGQEALLRRHPALRAEVVLAGLPAREEPLGEPLLEALQPRLVVIMDTLFPATRRASANLRARLERRPCPVVYCRDHGALTLEIAPGSWSLRDAAGELIKDAVPDAAARPQ